MNYKKRAFFLFGLSMNSIVNGESGIGILSKLSQLSMDLSRAMMEGYRLRYSEWMSPGLIPLNRASPNDQLSRTEPLYLSLLQTGDLHHRVEALEALLEQSS